MANENDPFAVFGDSDDEVDEADSISSSWAARHLVEDANQRMAQKSADDDVLPSNSDSKQENQTWKTRPVSRAVDLSKLEKLELWPQSPPLYLGPIQLVSSLSYYGGGRGYVATRPSAPGTLILVEEPMIAWPYEQLGKPLDLVSVRHILEHPSVPAATQMVWDMEDFHPTKHAVGGESSWGDDDNEQQVSIMMRSLHEQHKEDERLEELVDYAREHRITCRDGTPITTTDVLRLLLALRYNGLESGVYRHVAMLNHDCHPNSVKLQAAPGKTYSEVRTTRSVAAGEGLTISYLFRPFVSHATRRQYLWHQHRFDIGGAEKMTRNASWRRAELIGNALPPSSLHRRDVKDPASVTFRIEGATQELEELYHDAAAAATAAVVGSSSTTESNSNSNMPLSSSSSANVEATSSIWEQLRVLEISSQELYVEAKQQLRNDHHLLLIPCLRLHLNTCDLIQRGDPHMKKTAGMQRIRLLCRLVSTAYELRNLQKSILGNDHFDVAQTCLDLAQGIEELLGTAPKQLLKLKLEKSMTTIDSCSAFAHQTRKEYERIQALYPHDAEEHIASQQAK